jgi:hypothetical protein
LAKKIEKDKGRADLIIGNNVYAHVPDINDFTMGMADLLKINGTITLEFPHLLRLIEGLQFDTIYHEHYSYFSLHTVANIFKKHGLRVYHVEELDTHGGSLRIYGCNIHSDIATNHSVQSVLKKEEEFGILKIETYRSFQSKIYNLKNSFLQFLLEQKQKNKKIVAYGAAAKGNTLLNFAGVKSDLIPCVYDASPYKINKYLPGSRIPILSPELLKQANFDFLLILPWNLRKEIKEELLKIEFNNSFQFVTAIPSLTIE